MTERKRILFLGETFRADAITWIKGLQEFGDFEVITWELKHVKKGWKRLLRFAEYILAIPDVRKAVKAYKPHMVIAERTTSYGFLAAQSNHHPIAVAQQGKTDLWPENSPILFLKKAMQNYCFQQADLLHSWGPIMTKHMLSCGVKNDKILELPKGVDLRLFRTPPHNKPKDKIRAIVTRSMAPEYRHEIIIKSFAKLANKGIDFQLVLVGAGPLRSELQELVTELGIFNKVIFTGLIPNHELPGLLREANFYISMPLSEGVSASLFEAMATSNFPIVSDLEGNRTWINNGVNGMLVACDDVDGLADAISNSWDNRNLIEQSIRSNFEFVTANASYEKNMRYIADTYHKMIKGYEEQN